jgi:ribosomal-protein-serine acetyltransferase
MEPKILLDLPSEFHTARLRLRVPRAGDGEHTNVAIRESIDELRPWMPWVHPEVPQPRDTEIWCRNAAVKFLAREQFHFALYLKDTETYVGSCSIHRSNLAVPWVEIGYWLRTAQTGKGYMTESLAGVAEFAFTRLNAVRVEVRCDEKNLKSQRVAERGGFELEGTLRNIERNPLGELRDTRVYAKCVRPEPPSS